VGSPCLPARQARKCGTFGARVLAGFAGWDVRLAGRMAFFVGSFSFAFVPIIRDEKSDLDTTIINLGT